MQKEDRKGMSVKDEPMSVDIMTDKTEQQEEVCSPLEESSRISHDCDMVFDSSDTESTEELWPGEWGSGPFPDFISGEDSERITSTPNATQNLEVPYCIRTTQLIMAGINNPAWLEQYRSEWGPESFSGHTTTNILEVPELDEVFEDFANLRILSHDGWKIIHSQKDEHEANPMPTDSQMREVASHDVSFDSSNTDSTEECWPGEWGPGPLPDYISDEDSERMVISHDCDMVMDTDSTEELWPGEWGPGPLPDFISGEDSERATPQYPNWYHTNQQLLNDLESPTAAITHGNPQPGVNVFDDRTLSLILSYYIS